MAAGYKAKLTGGGVGAVFASQRVPTAGEVSAGDIVFNFPYVPTVLLAVVRVTATGVVKAWDGEIAVSGKGVTLNNAGATDWAATDTVSLLVTGPKIAG